MRMKKRLSGLPALSIIRPTSSTRSELSDKFLFFSASRRSDGDAGCNASVDCGMKGKDPVQTLEGITGPGLLICTEV